MRPQMFLLCHPYYYGSACVASYGRNSGRGEVSCGPQVKEFQVIAQELTYYGVDLYKRQMLPQLIEKSQKFQVWNGYVCIMLIQFISRWIYSA